jgi:oligoribonuclease
MRRAWNNARKEAKARPAGRPLPIAPGSPASPQNFGKGGLPIARWCYRMAMSTQPDARRDTRLVWVDLEMTGLNDKTCHIIEMAVIVTDGDLQELAMWESPIWQPDAHLETMVPFVRKMHTDNGLLDKVRTSAVSLADAEQKALELVSAHAPFRKGVLAGNSVWQDRRFMLRHMPLFEAFLHYRQVDVSSIKVLTQQWYGSRGEPPKKSSNHTALEDIRASIRELAWYRDNCFSLVPGP